MKKLIIDLRKENLKETLMELIDRFNTDCDCEGCYDNGDDELAGGYFYEELSEENIEEYMDIVLSCESGTLCFYTIDDCGNKVGTDDLAIGEIHLVEEMPDDEYRHMYHIASGIDEVLNKLEIEYDDLKAQKKQLKRTIKAIKESSGRE